ncbi:toxin-antitoxin system HicB family antitoxin [Campylobacter jejuni]
MTEEKENKGSYSLQIKIPNELKDKLEKKLKKLGIFKSVYNVSFY